MNEHIEIVNKLFPLWRRNVNISGILLLQWDTLIPKYTGTGKGKTLNRHTERGAVFWLQQCRNYMAKGDRLASWTGTIGNFGFGRGLLSRLISEIKYCHKFRRKKRTNVHSCAYTFFIGYVIILVTFGITNSTRFYLVLRCQKIAFWWPSFVKVQKFDY